MASHNNILFIGSIGLENEMEVFTSLGKIIGSRAKRYPDGETGVRSYWIRWVNDSLKKHPQLKLSGMRVPKGFKDNMERPFYTIRDNINSSDIDLGLFGYAKCAVDSYSRFKQLKDEGTIPEKIRFQVCLPTPAAILVGFFGDMTQPVLEPAMETTFKAEVNEILANIPNDRLSIQWDVCYEIVGHDGGPPLYYQDALEDSIERLTRLGSYVPESVELGYHLCYGDPGHKHIVDPEDLTTSVKFANAICAATKRDVNWIHMAVPLLRTDDAYFEPLKDLELRAETELYLGLIHLADGVEGSKQRITVAEKYLGDFGIATECGFGRRPPETIPELLQIHTDLSDLEQ